MYVIQERFKEWEKWEVLQSKGRFKTIEEARTVFYDMPKLQQSISRIAEEYTQVRYKPVKRS